MPVNEGPAVNRQPGAWSAGVGIRTAFDAHHPGGKKQWNGRGLLLSMGENLETLAMGLSDVVSRLAEVVGATAIWLRRSQGSPTPTFGSSPAIPPARPQGTFRP